MSQLSDRNKAAKRVTLIGAALDGVLGLMKIVAGIFAHSAALIADGIHSLSDLFTDFLVIFVFHIADEEPDESHPWGHARFETMATVILGTILIAVAGALALESAQHFFNATDIPTPTWPALLVALISVAAKEWIFRYTLAAGKKLKSDLLIANAWHSRSDALSSIVVLVGVAGAMLGWIWLDLLAAIAVALLVGKIGWDLTWNSIKQLVDTALPDDQVAALRDTVLEVDGIQDVHSFKTRRMGSKVLLEMHLQVNPRCSASEGHWLGDMAVYQLKKRFDDLGEVIFHVDTFDDEPQNVCRILPARQQILATLNNATPDLLPWQHSEIQLFYAHDHVDIELQLTEVRLAALSHQQLTCEALHQHFEQTLSQHEWLGKLRIWRAA